MKKIRVLIADKDEKYRNKLQEAIERNGDIEVVAHASNGIEVLNKTIEVRVDVVLVNIQTPKLDGISVTRKMIERNQFQKVIGISSINDDQVVFKMIESGSRGYILKDAEEMEYIKAIHQVYYSGHYFAQEILAAI